ncbi:MAG: 16S rRNA (guanine(527)-N(7))-methyltransferase RsmG [Thermoleophilaceae bacterium]
MGVKRETLARLLGRYGSAANGEQVDAWMRLLAALAAEPDPPTTVRAPEEALDVHVADSLSGLEIPELRRAPTIADIGSGAGFPGLALALALPTARVDLIEAAARKCAVIERLSAAAGAGRARAIPARVEEWAGAEGREVYDAVTARAVGPLAVLCEYAAPLLRPGGVLVAWKGRRDAEEEEAGARAAAELGMRPDRVVAVEPFPGAHSRHLHVVTKVAPTPERFPRRPGVASKRPLGG